MRCATYGLTPSRIDLPTISLLRPPSSSQFQPDPFPKLRIAASIRVQSKPSSFYDLLGIPETGSLSDVKHAYKQLARKYHPDVSPPDRVDDHTRRFIRVQEAYETLSDPARRALYDRDMAKGLNFALSARRRYCGVEFRQWKKKVNGEIGGSPSFQN
ncbi:unnamed protein product [Cuscuta campestris]|uniref:J domain-containing protein n=2 Tax=Cuscuta sect. Cleistogrammica TaxID=1824901 RepID=A0A484NL39_9ASTE|nr:hypothetical protein DM860_001560 [Cuscuta australis]VFR01148.1 unnamed protein product [Cuscuta campestris]